MIDQNPHKFSKPQEAISIRSRLNPIPSPDRSPLNVQISELRPRLRAGLDELDLALCEELLEAVAEHAPEELARGVLRDRIDELDAREPLELRLVVGDVLRASYTSVPSHAEKTCLAD